MKKIITTKRHNSHPDPDSAIPPAFRLLGDLRHLAQEAKQRGERWRRLAEQYTALVNSLPMVEADRAVDTLTG
jgi:hypothetical protein